MRLYCGKSIKPIKRHVTIAQILFGSMKVVNVAVAQCPASCGELIQGWILGSEKLVSCPVDWYSTVEVTTGTPLANELPLSRAMVKQCLSHWHYPAELSCEIRIERHSTIPVAKGMASSTADIAATAVATASYLGHELSEKALAALCVSLEPTDSTIFRSLTLFDHNNGATRITCDPQPVLDLLVLESPLTLRTEDYHRMERNTLLQRHVPALESAWEKVQQACMQNNPRLMGEATTLSAQASQNILPKPEFKALLSLVEECDLYGINVAHSGSVVGLLLDRNKHDVERVSALITNKRLNQHWPVQHLLKMVKGGATLQ